MEGKGASGGGGRGGGVGECSIPVRCVGRISAVALTCCVTC